MLMPVITRGARPQRHPAKGHRVHRLRHCDYLGRAAVSFVMALDAVGAWPPISRIARRDGRRLGAVRGVGAPAARRHRLGAGVRLRESSLGDIRDVMTLQLDPYYTAPLWPDAVSVAALQARAMLDAGKTHANVRWPRSRRAPAATRRRSASAQVTRRRRHRQAAQRALRRGAAAQARLPANLRRRGGHRARRGRSRAAVCAAAGVDPRHRPSHRAARARHARPHASRSTSSRGEKSGVPQADASMSPSCTRRSRTRIILRDARSASRRTSRSIRRAARSPRTR